MQKEVRTNKRVLDAYLLVWAMAYMQASRRAFTKLAISAQIREKSLNLRRHMHTVAIIVVPERDFNAATPCCRDIVMSFRVQ